MPGAGGWKLNDVFGVDVLGAVGTLVEILGDLSRGIAGFLNSNCRSVMAGAGGGGMLVTLVTLGGDGSLAASGGGVTGCFGAVSAVSSPTCNTNPLEEMSERRLVLVDPDLCGLVSIGTMVDSLAMSKKILR